MTLYEPVKLTMLWTTGPWSLLYLCFTSLVFCHFSISCSLHVKYTLEWTSRYEGFLWILLSNLIKLCKAKQKKIIRFSDTFWKKKKTMRDAFIFFIFYFLQNRSGMFCCFFFVWFFCLKNSECLLYILIFLKIMAPRKSWPHWKAALNFLASTCHNFRVTRYLKKSSKTP